MQNMDAMWIMEGRVGRMGNDMKDMEKVDNDMKDMDGIVGYEVDGMKG